MRSWSRWYNGQQAEFFFSWHGGAVREGEGAEFGGSVWRR